MQKKLIAMTSITYAMKAKSLLNNSGMYCEIERTPKNVGTGCGYSLRIKDNADKVLSLLDSNSVPHKDFFTTEG